ncbi:hypothetical protein ROZALSC1DRAFT_25595, partial [Rozella allomycis CSF55]
LLNCLETEKSQPPLNHIETFNLRKGNNSFEPYSTNFNPMLPDFQPEGWDNPRTELSRGEGCEPYKTTKETRRMEFTGKMEMVNGVMMKEKSKCIKEGETRSIHPTKQDLIKSISGDGTHMDTGIVKGNGKDIKEGRVRGKDNEKGGVDVGKRSKIKSNFNNLHRVITEDDEGGVDVAMGPEFDKIETKVEEGGVMESSGVAEGAMNKMNFEDDEGGVDDVLMGPEFDQFKTEVEKGGVKEQGGVAERIKSKFNNLHKMIEDDEGGVDVVMGPEFDQIDIAIEEGGVMGENDKKGGVYKLKLNMFANETGIEEGGVMVEGDEKGGVNVKRKIIFNAKGNIERGEGSVKRKNTNHFISNQEDESSINSFFSRRKRSRFNFVIDEEQAMENEILENRYESRVDRNDNYGNGSEFRVNQSQNQSHINPSFSINEDINGGEGGVQSS